MEPNTSIRIEICELIVKLYDVDIMEKNFYDIMTYTVLYSEDKNLKIKALDFWRKVIEVFLKRQGMLDGQFPEATFSKELKRIIHFDKKTIKHCLLDTLNKLSRVGCLAIFIHILSKQSDIQLYTTAIHYLEDFISLIKKYNITPAVDADPFASSAKPISFFIDFEENSFIIPVSPASNYLDFAYSYSALEYRKIVPTNDFLKFVYDLSDVNTKIQSNNDLDDLLDQILSNCI